MENAGIAVVVLYASLYAAVHSLLASDGAKALARRWFGQRVDRWYRLAYNVLAYVALVPSDTLIAAFPDRELYVLPDPWYNVAIAARVAAVIGLLYGISRLGVWDFFGLRQILQAPTGDSTRRPQLLTSGIYAWVRHPKYLFVLGILWFASRMTVNLMALYLVFSLYLYIGTFFEERRLVREFGSEYLEYRRRVPRILPIRWGHRSEHGVANMT